jgi:hypothetical protein
MSLKHPTTKVPDEVSEMFRKIKNVADYLADTKNEGCEIPSEFEIAGVESIAKLATQAEDAMLADHDEITPRIWEIQGLAETMAAAARAGRRLPASNYHVIEELADRVEELLQ